MNLISSLMAVIAVVSTTTTVKAKNANITEVDPTDWVQECAPAFQDVQWLRGNSSYYVNYSSYDLLKKPSGLCKPEFSCAYSKCIPENYQTPTGDRIDTFVSDFLKDVDMTTNTTYADVESVLGPGLNLPKMIVFPTDPSDVVNAIRHAKDAGLTVSIMSTGHSYTGASTNKNSVQLNLRDYPKYSETSIVECGNAFDHNMPSSSTSRISITEDDQAACKLALARGKKALVRVGGGEIFNDVANSVWAYKDNATAYAKYMMLHGVGTVGAAGGWLQGGGLGWGQERVWGLGVDQVLELEMVLADGRHVKFYPTEWENSDGYVYPKTTKVEGLCNKNIDDDESMWVWEECEDSIAFEDLWFAVRGGGGGTYGVVLSVKLQLHDNIPFHAFTVNEKINAKNEALLTSDNATNFKDELQGAVAYCRMNFSLNFLFNPSKLNVSRDDSNACGSPGFSPLLPILYCLGEDAGNAVKNAYDDSMPACLEKHASSIEYEDYGFDFVNDMELVGPFDSLLGFVNYDMGTNENVPGQLIDDGPSILPQARPWSGWCSAQVPESFLAGDGDGEDESATVESLLIETFLVHTAYGSHVTGGDVSVAHDQMNAVPMTERRSGFSSAGFSGLPTDLQERLLALFLKKNNDETASNNNNNNNFPGINEFNHMCSDSYGPLKSNTTKPCPMEYSEEEKEELCYSMQESVWGVDLTRKLESIKDEVDPDGLFYCYGCIQSSSSSSNNNNINNNNIRVPSPSTNSGENESTSSSSSSSSFSSSSIINSVAIMAAVVFGAVAEAL